MSIAVMACLLLMPNSNVQITMSTKFLTTCLRLPILILANLQLYVPLFTCFQAAEKFKAPEASASSTKEAEQDSAPADEEEESEDEDEVSGGG